MTKPGSLRLRQYLFGIITIVVALIISFIGFAILFERHIERRYNDELNSYVHVIASGLFVIDNKIHLNQTALPLRFDQPLSGLYWRVSDRETGDVLRSRSLWDIDLPQPAVTGRQGEFYIVARNLTLSGIDDRRSVLIEAAVSLDILHALRNEFAWELAQYLALLGIVLLVLMSLQIEAGLWPLRNLKKAVEKLTLHADQRMDNQTYREVQPLTDTINHLLDVRTETIISAQKRASDLAHGLKSPLAALRNQAQRLRDEGSVQTAQTLQSLALSLQRQIDRELTRTRAEIAAQKGPVSTNIYQLTQQLVRVLSNTAHGELIAWENTIPIDAILPIETSDMAEALGPILENAALHAKTQVSISYQNGQLMIDDDGPGMTDAQKDAVLERGVRFDERASSTGLGLSIAHDVLEPYAWGLKLEDSPLGGLRVRFFKTSKPAQTQQPKQSLK